MKYLKTFESSTNKLKIGYYVVASKFNNNPEVKEFFENNIGFIFNLFPNYSYALDEVTDYDLAVIYDYVPENVKKYANMRMVQGGWITNFKESQVIATAKTKKELKLKIAANKYNL